VIKVLDYSFSLLTVGLMAALPMLGSEMFGVVEQYGPVVGLVIWFVWRDSKREGRMADRINALESHQKETVEALVQSTTEALLRNSDSLRDMTEAIKGCQVYREGRGG